MDNEILMHAVPIAERKVGGSVSWMILHGAAVGTRCWGDACPQMSCIYLNGKVLQSAASAPDTCRQLVVRILHLISLHSIYNGVDFCGPDAGAIVGRSPRILPQLYNRCSPSIAIYI